MITTNIEQDYQDEKLEFSDKELKLVRNIMVFVSNDDAMFNIFDDIWRYVDKKQYKTLLTKLKTYLDKK